MVKNCLLFCLLFLPSLVAGPKQGILISDAGQKRLLKEWRQKFAETKTLACRFKQIKHLVIFEDEIQLQGWCYIAKPGQIRWEYIRPLAKTTVWNSGKVAIYKKGRRIAKNNRHREEQLVYRQIMAFFDGRFAEGKMRLEIRKQKKGNYLLSFQARETLAKFIRSIEVEIEPKNISITTVTIYESEGNYTRIEFADPLTNIKFSDNVFEGKHLTKFEHGLEKTK